MAMLTSKSISELISMYRFSSFTTDPSLYWDLILKKLKLHHPPFEKDGAIELGSRWYGLTTLEKRIFESPRNYFNVVAEWHRS